MTFPHISKTFVSGGTIHPERGMPRKETAEEMLGNLNINSISKEKIWGENLSDICPYVPGSFLNNWIAEKILVVFRANTESCSKHDCYSKPRNSFVLWIFLRSYNRSADINDMSDAATN
ncbi:trans-resveratrol di-O-methyltransferase-like [Gossypium australe]|uniref:Trans-resveratrol di-O-methyltransferase-like n=1 Tax=Gossypium australe TaxID=47621 RepID=A0A5B6X1U5_9ROSI|nr:trans-resveratrol di-O-methyltransferase-like [Gossypium australe]